MPGERQATRALNMKGKLTPKQRVLARHALGLIDGRTNSFRNRFVATPGRRRSDD